MSVNSIGATPTGPLGRKGRSQVEKHSEGDASPSRSRTSRTDSVGFSPEGLALAEQARSAAEGLAPERFAAIEERIANGFYDEPSVAEAVANRILDSGDLD